MADMEELRFKIRDKGRFGFMDEHGNVVIEPQYVEAEDFYNLFAKVKFNDHYVNVYKLVRLLIKQIYKFIGYRFKKLERRIQ
ncbi:MAG: WG repeat-containing protein, partial [Saprospiraceae bacterium]|nr:WG repeat-containing protein [Saprospiraceae bacterium]